MRKLYIVGLIAVTALVIGIAIADEIKFSTYYPAPFGKYREFDTTGKTCLATDEWGIEGDRARVGIGTTDPQGTLHVAGGTSGSGDGSDIILQAESGTTSTDSDGGNILLLPGSGLGSGVDGNVGIGTMNPSFKLEVRNGIVGDSDTGFMVLATVGSNAALRMGLNTDYAWIQSHGNRPLYINETRNDVILNGNTGNVGIGTTSPGAKLEVIDYQPGDSTIPAIIRLSNTLSNYDSGIASSHEAGIGQKLAFGHFHGNDTFIPDMTIRANGNVGIGTTTPAAKLHIYAGGLRMDSPPESGPSINLFTKADGSKGLGDPATNGWHLFARGDEYAGTPAQQNDLGLWFYDGDDASVKLFIEHDTGNVGIGGWADLGSWKLRVVGGSAAVDTGKSWTETSDVRLKKDISPIPHALEQVLQLKGVKYHTLDEAKGDPLHLGLVAQEVEKVVPELVLTGEDGYKALAYGPFSALFVEAIKELKAENGKLSARIEILEAKLNLGQ